MQWAVRAKRAGSRLPPPLRRPACGGARPLLPPLEERAGSQPASKPDRAGARERDRGARRYWRARRGRVSGRTPRGACPRDAGAVGDRRGRALPGPRARPERRPPGRTRLDQGCARRTRAPPRTVRARAHLSLRARSSVARSRSPRHAPRCERAEAIFGELGARLWLERTRRELARTGLTRSPDRELTPTELRVAELAAAGAQNKQIAGALFISVKTVEANLSRVYAKLGIRSRVELAYRLQKQEQHEAGRATRRESRALAS